MKNKNITEKEKVKKQINDGFTLVELLSVLTILSIIMTIVIYAATNIIVSTNQEGYKVTVNNIENEAGAYVYENSSLINWIGIDSFSEYQCISVQNLIDSGYFKSDVLKSEVENDTKVLPDNYIYIEREKNDKTITRRILLYGDRVVDYGGLCQNIIADGGIDISYEPMGWSRDKKITIKYSLYNNIDKFSNYEFIHEYDTNQTKNGNDNFYDRVVIKNVTVNKNGTLYASIKDKDNNSIASNSQVISGIDDIKPKIEVIYDGKTDVSDEVIIPIILTDDESGIDGDSFSEDDLNVMIGNSEAEEIVLSKIDNNHYELTIIDNENEGLVKITIDEILDNVGNVNKNAIFETNIKFSSRYMITLENQNATTVGTTGVTARYNSSNIEPSTITLPQRKYIVSGFGTNSARKSTGATISSTSNLTATYTFNGWYTASSGGSKVIDNNSTSTFVANVLGYTDADKKWIKESNTTLYAQWIASSITLPTIKKTGYTCGWTTSSSGTTITYNSGDSYTPTANTTMYGVCIPKTVTVTFRRNYNSSDTTSITQKFTYGESGQTFDSGYSRTGYTALGWSKTPSATSATYSFTSGVVDDWINENSPSVTLYAIWRVNKVYIQFNVNGGNVTGRTTNGTNIYTWTINSNGIVSRTLTGGISNKKFYSINYGSSNDLPDWNNLEYLNISKNLSSAVSGAEWKCISDDCEGKVYSDSQIYNEYEFCDVSVKDCTVTLGVNWLTYEKFTTNGEWLIWSRPGVLWWNINSKPATVKIFDEEKRKWQTGVNAIKPINYQNNYAMGTWYANKDIYIRIVGEYIYENDVWIRDKSDGTKTNPIIRVWIAESSIYKKSMFGCLYSVRSIGEQSCSGDLDFIEIGENKYWSAWVPWSCGHNSTCPPNEISVKEFVTNRILPKDMFD